MARLANTMMLLLLCGTFLMGATSASHHNRPSLRRGPRIPAPQVPLCDQEQLVAVANMLAHLREKQLCQTVIYEKEMLKTHNPKMLCYSSSCVDALQTLYRTLPKCRFRDWNVQLHTEMLLRNCGIQPHGAYDGEDVNRPLAMPSCSPEPATDADATRLEVLQDNDVNSPIQNEVNEANRAY